MTVDHEFIQGERINALVDAAYRGRINRRQFIRGLVAAGVAAAAARDMAEHAAMAQATQAAQLANLKDEYDYIVVGAGSAGCVMAHRLSQDGRSSVLVIEGGGTNIEQEKIINPGVYIRNIGSDTDWGNKCVPQKAPQQPRHRGAGRQDHRRRIEHQCHGLAEGRQGRL